jgi:tellurite resistance protein TehA-like permease
MTPIWVFPAYPLLLMGPLAANLIDALPDASAAARLHSIAIALAALCIQGTGFLVSLMIYSAFIYRLMTQKLPRETTRPGMVQPPFPIATFQVLANKHSSYPSGRKPYFPTNLLFPPVEAGSPGAISIAGVISLSLFLGSLAPRLPSSRFQFRNYPY